jgi:hypothetical protein
METAMKVLIKHILLVLAGWLMTGQFATAEVIFQLDFANTEGMTPIEWFHRNGFKSQNDADKLNLRFEDDRLIIATTNAINGILTKELDIPDVNRILIEWGVNRYPYGADWEEGVFREAVGVIVSFGQKKISSGSLVVPNIPYFIGLILGEKEIEGKAYVGNYYTKGGRYFCIPCRNPTGVTVITEFPLADTFREHFSQSKVPPVSALTIEADTRNTDGKSEAYIRRITFLR